jgi:hypothetical protein
MVQMVEEALAARVRRWNIILDPGFGFGVLVQSRPMARVRVRVLRRGEEFVERAEEDEVLLASLTDYSSADGGLVEGVRREMVQMVEEALAARVRRCSECLDCA